MKWPKYIFIQIAKYFGFDIFKENKELQDENIQLKQKILELENKIRNNESKKINHTDLLRYTED